MLFNLQIKETVSKKKLFNNYFWVTGTSSLIKRYAEFFVNKIIKISKCKKNDLIIEIGSNDGTFLKIFKKNRFNNLIGIDPAKNLSKLFISNKINIISNFWNYKTSSIVKNRFGKAKVIYARNVIPHVSELDSVMRGIKNILDNNGYGFIEFHSAHSILEKLQYDPPYHEHLNYFSVISISKLLFKYNFYIFDVFKSPMNGGSICVCFSRKNIKIKKLL